MLGGLSLAASPFLQFEAAVIYLEIFIERRTKALQAENAS
jgi:hypothetical protein